MQNGQSVVIETRNSAVRLLRINRPEARNALNLDVRRLISAALAEASASDDVRAVVITGDDKSFAAGADIGEMKDASPPEIYARKIEHFWDQFTRFPKPLIAAVQGYALGAGFELVLNCDIVIAGQSARFALPEVRLGIMPGGGGTQRFSRLAGKQIALRYMLTGDRFDAAEAQRYGVVSEITEDEKTLERAISIAEAIAELPPLSVLKIKEAVLKGLDAPLESGLVLERQSYYFLNATEDKAEGVSAFLEKRPAHFKGR